VTARQTGISALSTFSVGSVEATKASQIRSATAATPNAEHQVRDDRQQRLSFDHA
jgi:hypothetical protein